MIITCPHCQTKYQVTFEAIGSAGRKVQCAQCGRAWDQVPPAANLDPAPLDAEAEADRLFDDMAEDALDEVMAEEERAHSAAQAKAAPAAMPVAPAVPAPAQTINAAEMRKRQAAFSRRQSEMSSRLPLARLRRTARILGVLMAATLVLGLYFGRAPIVARYPDLAGVYQALGLGVNVVGLEFSGLETLKTLSGGNEVLMVSAQIVGVEPRPVPVPPVVISLLDAMGRAVYEWSVTPQTPNLMAGERATFDTRLSLPPSEAVGVRLSFAGGSLVSNPQTPGITTDPAETVAPVHAHPAPDQTQHATPEEAAPASSSHH
jgi:predicted Zn finger-like uncharacterized protein